VWIAPAARMTSLFAVIFFLVAEAAEANYRTVRFVPLSVLKIIGGTDLNSIGF
jgi:hypothetical protein